MTRATAALLAGLVAAVASSPLYDYVHADDGAFAWFDTGHMIESSFDNLTKAEQWKGYYLNVTSQKWLTPADFVGPYGHVWTHQVLVIVPEQLNASYSHIGAIYITGNGNDSGYPDTSDEDVLLGASIAVGTGTVVAILFQAPNSPVIFASDPARQSRSEDALVAWTWRQFMLEHPDQPEWTAYYPMAKSAVKAMDAVELFMANKTQGAVQLKQWAVAGASKRGATTWFTGAVDPRVIAIIPMVFDALNFKDVVEHMWMSLGNWSFALVDYLNAGVMSYLNDGTGRFAGLAQVVDPLSYKENLTMPKLVVSATGDEFFQLQDDSFWWGQLPGNNAYRLMVDNAEHSLATGILTIIPAILSFLKGVYDKAPLPTMSWSMDQSTGAISLVVTGPLQPTTVVNRVATTLNGKRRDFRVVQGDTPANPCTDGIPINMFGNACIVPLFWTGQKVGRSSWDPTTNTSVWTLTQDLPAVGWRAWLGEMYFPSTTPGVSYRFTTQASITPAAGFPVFPFPLCAGEECVGGIV